MFDVISIAYAIELKGSDIRLMEAMNVRCLDIGCGAILRSRGEEVIPPAWLPRSAVGTARHRQPRERPGSPRQPPSPASPVSQQPPRCLGCPVASHCLPGDVPELQRRPACPPPRAVSGRRLSPAARDRRASRPRHGAPLRHAALFVWRMRRSVAGSVTPDPVTPRDWQCRPLAGGEGGWGSDLTELRHLPAT